jgi:anti-sigma regulatory factor (Ser/Thr protein kinase)
VRDPIAIPVDDPSRPGEVRRAAVALAASLAFSEEDQGRVALIATEAATNLVKYATGGEIVLRSLAPVEGGGIEVLALDRGPGIGDVGRCLQDGFSTAGTPGHGLGAIGRLADQFDITSTPRIGTALVARARPASSAIETGPEIGAVCLPVASEEVCGDAWAVEVLPDRTVAMVADGLGHGLPAATAAREAVRVFRQVAREEPADILQALHAALRPTRGAAAAIAVIDPAAGRIRYAGVGNVAGTLIGSAGRQGLVSMSGTLGHEVRKVSSFDYPWPTDGLLLMHSDGLGTQWDLSRYPGLAGRHPTLICGVLYRDGRRARDDVTVLALRGVGGDAR